MMRLLRALAISSLAIFASPLTAAAQGFEDLCDTKYEDCRSRLLQLIRNEQSGVDVAFWYMQDYLYYYDLVAKHRAGVPVRILVDQRANASYPLNDDIINDLRAAGIPMREKFTGDIMHLKMMLFHGQNTVEFSKANYGPYALRPATANVDYDDEAVFFTNDSALTNSFRTRFDDLWTNTSLYRNLANVSGELIRHYPTRGALAAEAYPIHSSMNFVPLENFATRSAGRYNAETQAIDAIVYRITDSLLPNAIISAASRGVNVRLITEPAQYRDLDKRWHSAHVDRMYMEGVRTGRLQIKHAVHEGLMHQASVVLHGLGEVIFGSSNWTTHSGSRQDEHNYFYSGNGKPWFLQWFKDQFLNKWNDTVNYVPFQPQRPPTASTPAASGYIAPTNGAALPTTSVTLTWDGGPWAHLYDIQMGTTPTSLALVGPPNQQLGSPNDGARESVVVTNLQPGTTYYWRIISKTFALQTQTGPVWSFTTAGTPPAGGGCGTAYGGTCATIPGRFEAENFDEGGQSVAYSDTTTHDSGGTGYRSTGVDIGRSTAEGGAYYVGWTKAGEWLQYTVDVPTAGTYTLTTRLAALGDNGRFYLEVDGARIQPSVDVPNTTSWDTWQDVAGPSVTLSQGRHVLRVVMERVGSGNAVAGFNWFQLGSTGGSSTPPPPSTTPAYPNGTPAAIPGFVQAENFDTGPAGVAYSDTTTHNSGGDYRSTGVDIDASTDPEGGEFYVGWTKAGEWLTYTVDIATTGTYTLETRLAALGTGGRFRVEVDQVDRTGTIEVPNTGAWNNWQTLATPNLSLTAGRHVLRVVMEAVGTGNAVAGFNWFRFVRP